MSYSNDQFHLNATIRQGEHLGRQMERFLEKLAEGGYQIEGFDVASSMVEGRMAVTHTVDQLKKKRDPSKKVYGSEA